MAMMNSQLPRRSANIYNADSDSVEATEWVMTDQSLGSGGFGDVWLGILPSRGNVAIAVKKILFEPGNTQRRWNNFDFAEAPILQELTHPNIVRFLGASAQGDGYAYIFMDLVNGKSLYDITRESGPQNEDFIRKYFRQILLGIQYLHGKNIMHRDLKGKNIMLTSRGLIKLVDFGLSRLYVVSLLSNSQHLFHTDNSYGTVNYMSPEFIRDSNYCAKSDIWSFGCTIIEVAYGKIPWSGLQAAQIIYIVGNGSRPVIEHELITDSPPDETGIQLSRLLREVASLCLTRSISIRPSATTLLAHPFFEENKCGFDDLPSPLITDILLLSMEKFYYSILDLNKRLIELKEVWSNFESAIENVRHWPLEMNPFSSVDAFNSYSDLFRTHLPNLKSIRYLRINERIWKELSPLCLDFGIKVEEIVMLCGENVMQSRFELMTDSEGCEWLVRYCEVMKPRLEVLGEVRIDTSANEIDLVMLRRLISQIASIHRIRIADTKTEKLSVLFHSMAEKGTSLKILTVENIEEDFPIAELSRYLRRNPPWAIVFDYLVTISKCHQFMSAFEEITPKFDKICLNGFTKRLKNEEEKMQLADIVRTCLRVAKRVVLNNELSMKMLRKNEFYDGVFRDVLENEEGDLGGKLALSGPIRWIDFQRRRGAFGKFGWFKISFEDEGEEADFRTYLIPGAEESNFFFNHWTRKGSFNKEIRQDGSTDSVAVELVNY